MQHWTNEAVEFAAHFAKMVDPEGPDFDGFLNVAGWRIFPAGGFEVVDDVVHGKSVLVNASVGLLQNTL